MVASDRSLGGFGHEWGDGTGPKVQRKMRMLEEEGVVFEDDGKRIKKEYFVESTTSASAAKSAEADTTTKPKRKTAKSKEAKKRKAKESISNESTTSASSKSKSKYFNTNTTAVSEAKLKQEILNLLQKRQAGKTC